MAIGDMISKLFQKNDDKDKPTVDRSKVEEVLSDSKPEHIHKVETMDIHDVDTLDREKKKQSAKDEEVLDLVEEVTEDNDKNAKAQKSQAATDSSHSEGDVNEAKVLQVLSEVYDPEIPIDIVNLGLVYDIDIDDGTVDIKMTMTSPGCPASTQIASESKLLVEDIPGVKEVKLDIVWDPPWDPSKMSPEAQESLGLF